MGAGWGGGTDRKGRILPLGGGGRQGGGGRRRVGGGGTGRKGGWGGRDGGRTHGCWDRGGVNVSRSNIGFLKGRNIVYTDINRRRGADSGGKAERGGSEGTRRCTFSEVSMINKLITIVFNIFTPRGGKKIRNISGVSIIREKVITSRRTGGEPGRS